MSEQIQFEIGDRVWSLLDDELGTVVEVEAVMWVCLRLDSKEHLVSKRHHKTVFFEKIVIPESARTRKPKDTVFTDIAITSCGDCGCRAEYELVTSMKSSVYGVIFENLALCRDCADRRYVKKSVGNKIEK